MKLVAEDLLIVDEAEGEGVLVLWWGYLLLIAAGSTFPLSAFSGNPAPRPAKHHM